MVHPSALGSTRTELVGALDAHPLSHRLWRRLKPLVLGKVNQTFQGLALLKGIQEVWELLGAPLLNFANDSAGVARLQRLLQVTGRRQPGAGGQDRGEALRAFLNPRSGGCSWHEAHADMGHLVGTLGRDGGPEEDSGTSDPRPSPSQCVTLDELEAAPSEAALVERALELLSEPEDFPDSSQSPGPGHVRIKIRMDIDDVTRANKIRDRFWDPGAAADALVWGGFVYLQDLLERAALRVLTGAAPRAGLYLQQMPYTCYVDDAFLRVLSRSLPLFLMLAWIYSVALTVKAVVREKETRLCCTMCAMGLSGAVLWLGWFLSCLGPFLLSTALLVLVLKVGAHRPSRLQNGCASNLAAACAGLAYFVLYLPYVLCVAWRDQLPVGGRVAASLVLPVAFGCGCESLALLEKQGEGAQWHNVGTGPIADVFSLAQVSGLLLLDAALYDLATWYLEAVCPGEYGIPEPWNVPFGGATGLGLRPPSAQPPAPQDPKGVSIRSLEKRFPGNPQPALHGLSLDFYQGLITAFLGHNGAGKTTTFPPLKEQLLCDPCTPRSILTGLFPPTAGSACVLGHDVRSNMAAIRPHLGVCPQYSVLFDMLTVDEHVWFYGRLKSLSAAAVGPEQDHLMQDVGLVPKRHAQTRHLSGEEPLGGIQWKLSVAIAFVGGSQVVILDEPTAGVDPASRRGIRELLLKYQDDRTLILSTHHLDEAELLGDRVAVVAGGRLCCCGSPLFLWCHLVSRYYLTLVKCPPALATSKKGDPDLKDNMDPGQEREPGSQASTAGEGRGGRARSHVPGARLVKELPHELVLALPYQGAPDSSFAELFCELDQRLGKLGLAGFGISDTSLEEVWLLGEIFLKVVEDCAVDTGPGGAAADGRPRQYPCSGIAHLDATARLQILLEESALENGGLGSAPETQALQSSGPDAAGCVHGWVLAHQQLRALLLKRFLLACCSRCGLFAQIVLPALFMGLALVFSLIMPPFGYYPALQLSPSMYGSQVSFFRAPECTQPAVCQFSVPEVPADVAKVLASGNWTPESPSPACQCSQPGAHCLLPNCPAVAGCLPPPQAPTSSGKVVQDLTGRKLSDFLVKTYPRLVRQGLKTKKWVNEVRYGGFSLGGRDPGLPSGLEVGRSVEELRALLNPQLGGALDHILNNLTAWALGLDIQDGFKIWFNNKGWHAVVAFVNRANNALLLARLPLSPAHRAHSITTLNHPLNLTKEQLSEATLMASSVDVLVSICVVFAMSFVPASFTLELSLGHVSIVVVIFLAFQQRAYVASANLPALLLLLLLYDWSITPLMYPPSSFFSMPSMAYMVLTCINLFIGINGSMATFVLELFSDQKLQEVSWILKRVFLIFPHFCLGWVLIDMVRNQAMADAFERLGDGQFQSPLRWEVVSKNLLAMLIQGPIFLLFTLLLQHHNCLLPQPKLRLLPALGEEDEDVARERGRVVQGTTERDVLVLRDLTKVCPGQRTLAVNLLCLGISPGECFGLLGVNGEGKTSTFHMVTGDTVPSGGEVVLAGHSVAREPAVAHCRMGYCPQLDAIFELLTGREHLELFARLRGTASSGLGRLGRLGLPQCADSPVGTYSRGNKRKLATAVVLVGDPAVVSLAWPELMAPGSHSMEESEALCTHLAIMVNGRFRCLVSTQHLQGRFGAGHMLTLRVSESQSESVAAFVAATFPGAELREVRGGRLRFQLPPGARCALGHLFGELAARGAEHGVEDFSVSQTTLEEDQGKEEDEKDAEVGADPVPGPQNPRLITQFLEDHSMAGTVL
ncbi:phospholipid-transporting ATPase ABCA7 [Globicephala melas]|uniref:phospholipid-transporting ATPase ABCA7 n=1 Tax=Globicephala melas TaxID=9731 RepID=UPI00293D6228|nr:phospholipid-transporting ATPase ABCA7 [Globicephala melas]